MQPLTLSQEIAHLEYKVLHHRSDGREPNPGQFMAAYERLQSLYASLPRTEELEIPFTDEPTEETAPFTVQIDGERLAPATTYDNAGLWTDILAGHFPDANIGIVLA